MDASEDKRFRKIELGNAKNQWLLAEASQNTHDLQTFLKQTGSPQVKRLFAGRLTAEHHICKRRVWALVGLSRYAYRYEGLSSAIHVELSEEIVDLANKGNSRS